MSEAAAAAPADPGATIRSKSYRVLLVFAALIGVLISVLPGTGPLDSARGVKKPAQRAGISSRPWWWPLPVLAVAGVLAAVAIVRLPGRGGHIPYEGIKAGTAKPA